MRQSAGGYWIELDDCEQLDGGGARLARTVLCINSASVNFARLDRCGKFQRNCKTTPTPMRRLFCTLVVELGSWVRSHAASMARSETRGDK
jgi:hypothetical protein